MTHTQIAQIVYLVVAVLLFALLESPLLRTVPAHLEVPRDAAPSWKKVKSQYEWSIVIATILVSTLGILPAIWLVDSFEKLALDTLSTKSSIVFIEDFSFVAFPVITFFLVAVPILFIPILCLLRPIYAAPITHSLQNWRNKQDDMNSDEVANDIEDMWRSHDAKKLSRNMWNGAVGAVLTLWLVLGILAIVLADSYVYFDAIGMHVNGLLDFTESIFSWNELTHATVGGAVKMVKNDNGQDEPIFTPHFLVSTKHAEEYNLWTTTGLGAPSRECLVLLVDHLKENATPTRVDLLDEHAAELFPKEQKLLLELKEHSQ